MTSLPWGLLPSGFRARTLEEILETMRARAVDEIRDANGNALLNTKIGPVHNLLGIVASEAREVWEAAESVHSAINRDGAAGASLDFLGALTGTPRLAATKSTVTLKLTLDAAVTVPVGSIVSVTGAPTKRFYTLAEVVSVHAGYYEVEAEAETAGVVAANAGTIEEIETPVTGWTAVTNALDAVQGTEEEEDPDYRARAEDGLDAQGSTPQDAIRADLLQLLADRGVTRGSVQVFMNTTDATDGDGLPPHSVEAVVYDGTDDGTAVTDDEIAQVLWDNVAAGIETYGTSNGDATDSLGGTRVVEFTRPTVKPVYIVSTFTASTARGWDAVAGATEVAAALVELAEELYSVGDDVQRFRLIAFMFSVAGVIDVSTFTLGYTASPVGTANLAVARREIATFDTSRVSLTPSLVSPP